MYEIVHTRLALNKDVKILASCKQKMSKCKHRKHLITLLIAEPEIY